MPCLTSHLLKNLQYLDLSDNLLTDLTLEETLCGTTQTLKDIRVLNFSGNALKVKYETLIKSALPTSIQEFWGLMTTSTFHLSFPISVQSLSTVSRLVTKFSKLTHLDISRTSYSFMPSSCPWPSTLRFLNISGAKFTAITPCLPQTLEVWRPCIDLADWPGNLFFFPLCFILYRCWIWATTTLKISLYFCLYSGNCISLATSFWGCLLGYPSPIYKPWPSR